MALGFLESGGGFMRAVWNERFEDAHPETYHQLAFDS